jgi:hypothetical protein
MGLEREIMGGAKLVFLALAASAFIGAHGQFNYSNFTTSTGMAMNGSASVTSGRLRITPVTAVNQAGSVWRSQQQEVADGFDTTFRFLIHGGFSGQGLAFVVQNQSTAALGSFGSGMGYANITKSLAVEFDTVQNVEMLDPSAPHISVQTRFTQGNSASVQNSLGFTVLSGSIRNTVQSARIWYRPGIMRVFLNGAEDPDLEVAVNLNDIGLNSGKAWVGFTAATSDNDYDIHDVLSWSYQPVWYAVDDDGGTAVPEPATGLMMGGLLLALALAKRRK